MKKKPLLLLLFLLFTTVSIASALETNTYYVSTDGDHNNDGTIESPWRSITESIEKLDPGDTLIIKSGTYHESIQITNTGSEQSYIHIRSEKGEKPVIDGTGIGGNGIVISAAYLNISGLNIRNWDENGIWVENSQFIDIRNCQISKVQYGIGFADGSHDFTVKDCIITQFALYGFDASPSGGADCYNALIENCTAFSGSDPEQNVDGFATGHGDQTGIIFIDCTTYNVYDGFDISSDNTQLISCLSYTCGNAGYKIWGNNVTLVNCIGLESNTNLELDWSGTPKTVNVLYSDFVGSETFNIWVENKLDRLTLMNSIVVNGDNIGICFENGYSETYTGDFNLFQNNNPDRIISIEYEEEYSIEMIQNGEWSKKTGQDKNSITTANTENIFRDIDNLDLYPSPNSPLIDSANPIPGTNFDYLYRPRPNGETPDIGAYEYYADTSKIGQIKPQLIIPQQQTNEENQENHPIPIVHAPILAFIAIIIVFRGNYFRRERN